MRAGLVSECGACLLKVNNTQNKAERNCYLNQYFFYTGLKRMLFTFFLFCGYLNSAVWAADLQISQSFGTNLGTQVALPDSAHP